MGVNEKGYVFGVNSFRAQKRFQALGDFFDEFNEIFDGDAYDNIKSIFQVVCICNPKDQQPIIVARDVPTKMQEKLNCHSKSLFVLLRFLVAMLDNDFEIQLEGAKLQAGFMEFDDSNIGGIGYEEYKKFKRGFVDYNIEKLRKVVQGEMKSDIMREFVGEALRLSLEKTEEKLASVADSPKDATYEKRLQSRKDGLKESLASLAPASTMQRLSSFAVKHEKDAQFLSH